MGTDASTYENISGYGSTPGVRLMALEDSLCTSKLMVLYFIKNSDRHCRNEKSKIEDLSKMLTDVEFIQIGVDELDDVKGGVKVETLPTYLLIKSGNVVDQLVNPKIDKLKGSISRNNN